MLGEKIRQLRIARGMRQKDLAEAVGVSPVTMNRYETGKREPSYSVLSKISRVLDAPNGYFFVRGETEHKGKTSYASLPVEHPDGFNQERDPLHPENAEGEVLPETYITAIVDAVDALAALGVDRYAVVDLMNDTQRQWLFGADGNLAMTAELMQENRRLSVENGALKGCLKLYDRMNDDLTRMAENMALIRQSWEGEFALEKPKRRSKSVNIVQTTADGKREVKRMIIRQVDHKGVRCAVIQGNDPIITDVQSALDVMMAARHHAGTTNLVISKALIAEDFFVLSTGLAGEILQKYQNYGCRIAIVGDFSHYTSKPLHDFIYECNQGKDVFFVGTEEDGIERLTR